MDSFHTILSTVGCIQRVDCNLSFFGYQVETVPPPPQDKCLGGKGLLLWSSVENVGVAMEVTLS